MTAVSVLVTKINNTMNENYRAGAHLRVQSRPGVDKSRDSESLGSTAIASYVTRLLTSNTSETAIDASGVSREKTQFCTPLPDALYLRYFL